MALQALGAPVDVRWHLGEGYAHNTPDDVWLADVGQKGWIVLSQDHRFHLSEASRRAIAQHSIGCFYLGGANERVWDTARFLLSQWDRMTEIVETATPPYIYRLKRNGQIDRISFDVE